MTDNRNLEAAKKRKYDEFYTQLEDIEKEVLHYTEQFRGKTVYCNCDDPDHSNFFKFFVKHFERLGIKKVIATGMSIDGGPEYKAEFDGRSVKKTQLKGNGDFRSEECLKILGGVDIVATNPPFSLLGEFVHTVAEYHKDFVIIGTISSLKYSHIFPLIQAGQVRCGYNCSGRMNFIQKGGTIKQIRNIIWLTTFAVTRRGAPVPLTCSYAGNEHDYPMMDNYRAINVDTYLKIPRDFCGAMGVPLTILTKDYEEDFELLGISAKFAVPRELFDSDRRVFEPVIDGHKIFSRVFVRRKCTAGRMSNERHGKKCGPEYRKLSGDKWAEGSMPGAGT